jgi:hypothetical protein
MLISKNINFIVSGSNCHDKLTISPVGPTVIESREYPQISAIMRTGDPERSPLRCFLRWAHGVYRHHSAKGSRRQNRGGDRPG